uniref:X-ray repair cross-complementing protein 6 n=1 Tax=Geotrypetes seraphini TaxID=260995 RepID=A0A6P8QDE9_GEOSA|nr:X-ray repair cross-complementing protein 6 [Geotrypetes seraphini]XP_033785257.1 X-ray repair cross-complementing protein 6 [Geotrypetes seraphini]XP_033785258.1 X-ray repair cross-complementing protein 6 [Geotrypetes seraphini]
MADWKSFIPDEDELEEEEEGAETGGEYRFSGRDSLIFLVDASKAMFESLDDDGNTCFDLTIQCIRSVYTSKIISSERDLLGLVFFGTEKHKNSVEGFNHIYVLHELDTPGAKRVLELDKYKGKKGRAYFSETIGHSKDFSLGQALWICANLFSDVKLRMSHKRIMLFTNDDHPHVGDSTKIKFAFTKASDLRETGIFLDLMHLKKDGGFDVSCFYRDIINTAEDEDLGVHFQESAKLEDLMKKVRAKEAKKRALCRLNLKLSKDLVLGVGVFNLVQKAFKPAAVKLYRETNEPVKTKTRTFNQETGSLMLPSDTKRAQVYGNRKIVLEKEETEQVKHFDEPSLVLIGFKPLALLKKHHFVRPAQFLYPEESLVTGSTTLFNALLTQCLEREVMALCRYTPRRNIPPRFVALVPQEEKMDSQNVQVTSPGFHLMFLPFIDDIRKLDISEKMRAGREQVEKMKEIVQKLRFKYRSDDFENPVLQQHFRNLEALALDLMEPEPLEDLTLPKVEMMDRRLGPLVEEFKELVYPPNYNPEGKAVKRKTGEDKSQAEKKVKTEASVSEENLKSYVKNGTLGKLTVPVLKEACRSYGLKGSKKQELVDALSDYFKKH